jgi:hypothetical protein
MKNNIVIIFLLALPFISLSQNAYSKKSLSHEEYLEKSKNQKNAGFAMLGGGSVLFLIGFAIYSDQGLYTPDGVVFLAGVGAISVIASIPVFVSSGENARKAATLSFGNQPHLFPQLNQSQLNFQPALTLKIALTK